MNFLRWLFNIKASASIQDTSEVSYGKCVHDWEIKEAVTYLGNSYLGEQCSVCNRRQFRTPEIDKIKKSDRYSYTISYNQTRNDVLANIFNRWVLGKIYDITYNIRENKFEWRNVNVDTSKPTPPPTPPEKPTKKIPDYISVVK